MILFPCVCSDEDVGHDYVSEREDGPVLDDCKGVWFYTIRCSGCGHEDEISKSEWDEVASGELKAAQRKRAHLTRYPRIEPHTGMLVKSKQHEAETVQAAGYHVAENGVNEKYDDDTAEFFKAKTRATKERREAIRKKREHLIREGVIKRPKKRA